MPVTEVVVVVAAETGQEMIEVTDPVVILGRKASQHFLSDDLPARRFFKTLPIWGRNKALHQGMWTPTPYFWPLKC